jgi:hypothetical protein
VIIEDLNWELAGDCTGIHFFSDEDIIEALQKQ